MNYRGEASCSLHDTPVCECPIVTDAMQRGTEPVPGAIYSHGGDAADHLQWLVESSARLQAWRHWWKADEPELFGEYPDLERFAEAHPDAFVVHEEICVWTTLPQSDLPFSATVSELAFDDVQFELNGEAAGGRAHDFADLIRLWSVHGEWGGTDATLVDGKTILFEMTDMEPDSWVLDRPMTPREAALHSFPPEMFPEQAEASSDYLTWDDVKSNIPTNDLNHLDIHFNGQDYILERKK